LLPVVLLGATTPARAAADSKKPTSAHFLAAVKTFLVNHCVACHDGEDGEGGLDLTTLQSHLDAPGEMARWIRIFERVSSIRHPCSRRATSATRQTTTIATCRSFWPVGVSSMVTIWRLTREATAHCETFSSASCSD